MSYCYVLNTSTSNICDISAPILPLSPPASPACRGVRLVGRRAVPLLPPQSLVPRRPRSGGAFPRGLGWRTGESVMMDDSITRLTTEWCWNAYSVFETKALSAKTSRDA